MYAGGGFSDWEIGDIDVFVQNGVYHLFHLIIPNHDYIAHAISTDGISWRRVDNALFVGHPGAWDDDMLWTMHATRRGNLYYLFYTGLAIRDRGMIQKIGIAISDDLIRWEKRKTGNFPIGSCGPHYEDLNNNPRGWLSFRDPYYYEEEGQAYLLVCGRSAEGPFSRRGCVGLLQLTEDNNLAMHTALLYPRMYDDVECPCLFKLNDRYYLLGSIREDIKVRYWFSDEIRGEYHSFHSDVLLPQGNYAARVVKDNGHWLLYNFYFMDGRVNSKRVLPPPKQLDTDAHGRLVLTSFYRWETMTIHTMNQSELTPVRALLNNPTASMEVDDQEWRLQSRSGYELFCFSSTSTSYIWEGRLTVEGLGKCGLFCDVDQNGNGYFIPFDVVNGLVKIRTWGCNPDNMKEDFIFKDLQSNLFIVPADRSFHFKLIRYGNYFELSLDGVIRLTLIDYTFSAPLLGLYSASSRILLSESTLKSLPHPVLEYASQEPTE